MPNKYFKGEKVFLYTKFFDNNGLIPENISNPKVRILHEQNNKIYQDMGWTKLENIGGNEYFSKYDIPYNSDNGIYHIMYQAEINGITVKNTEDFHVIEKSEIYTDAIKLYGNVNSSYDESDIPDVSIKIRSLDGFYYTESYTFNNGYWETFLYPGEYEIEFTKEGYEPLNTIFEIGTENNEIQFSNITLQSFKKRECGEGICEVSDEFVLKNGIGLNGLLVECYNIEDIKNVCARAITNNDGKWKVFLDPGIYLMKVSGTSMNEVFERSFRIRIDNNCEFKIEDMNNNTTKPKEKYMSNGDGPVDYEDKIVDALQNPISDVQVNIIAGSRIIAECYTDDNGRYIFHLYHGRYMVEMYHPNYPELSERKSFMITI